MAKKNKIGLLPLIIIAIALGIGAGYLLPVGVARIFMTFNAVFSQFLGFCIPLIILSFVAPAIADIGGRAGKMLVFTAALAYVATLCAGFASYFTGDALFPRMIEPMAYAGETASECSIAPYFTIEMPPLFGVMTALVLSFVLGLGASGLGKESVMKGFLTDLRSIVAMVINRAIIPLLPLYIFGIFLNMTMEGQVGAILMTFLKIIAVIFALHVLLLVAQFAIASLFSSGPVSHNPFKLLWTMMPQALKSELP